MGIFFVFFLFISCFSAFDIAKDIGNVISMGVNLYLTVQIFHYKKSDGSNYILLKYKRRKKRVVTQKQVTDSTQKSW